MKRGEIIEALREAQADRANAHAWLTSADEKIIALIHLLEEGAPPPGNLLPHEIEYDRNLLDSQPRPVVSCKCGDPAKRIQKEGRNGKPYVAWACPNPKAEGCDFWVFDNQLQGTK